MSVTNLMAKSTVRIECFDADREGVSIGSSFCCSFPNRANCKNEPVLITNKHVVDGFRNIRIVLSTSLDPRQATLEQRRTLTYDRLDEVVYFHDNPDIDLAAIWLRPILDRNVNDGSTIDLKVINIAIFITESIESQLRFVEDVLVVGYPHGLWDRTRNLPLFRRGVTSSPAMLDFNGEPKFLIDCSIFPGSSGSPVFLYNFPAYFEDGKINLGERWALLGVVSSVLNYNVEGTVEEVEIPTTTAIAKTSIPNNIGVVIKVKEIMKLSEAFARAGWME